MTSPTQITYLDVRGPRFGAAVTSVVLIAVLLLSAVSPLAAGIVLTAQTVVFALGAVLGPAASPYGRVFRSVVAPKIGPVTETEPASPVRFSQLVGFVFAAVGLVGFVAGLTPLALVATAFALVAGLLNAVFGLCLGCQIYPLFARFGVFTG